MQSLIPPGKDVFRRNNFDAIRLAMALLVVWSHSFAFYFGTEDREPIALIMNDTYNAGNVGVLVFFIISGFLISHSYLSSKSLLEFFQRRVRRIYPGYIAATMIAAFIIVPLFSTRTLTEIRRSEAYKIIPLNILLQGYMPQSNAFGGEAVNGSLWSIPFEFWCYIGLAILGIVGLLSKRSFCLAIIVAAMAGRTWLDVTGRNIEGGIVGLIVGWPPRWFVVLPCFMIGVVVYLYREVIPRSKVLLIIGLASLLIAANLLPPQYNQLFAHMLFPPVIAYVVFFIAFSTKIRAHDIPLPG